jgi:hypothetical protein
MGEQGLEVWQRLFPEAWAPALRKGLMVGALLTGVGMIVSLIVDWRRRQ